MTSHYIDLKLLPDPEIGPNHLLGALYDRLHQALVQHGKGNIGVSFPGYSINPRTLGCSLRLHGDGETLGAFMQTDWLRGVRDHVRMSEIAPAPADACHRSVQRKQFKTSAARLRRRRMRRKGETQEQARAAIPDCAEQRSHLPYAYLHSRSTRQPFPLFIRLGALQPGSVVGPFDTYGLSQHATIPWF